MSGVIYIILNIKNGKYYLGSTSQYKKREYTHKWKLNKGIHHSSHLQNAWNKYGENAFQFKILYESNDIRNDEQSELDRLDYSEVYNISRRSSGGDMNANHPRKKEIFKKISKTKKFMKIKPPNRIKVEIHGVVYDSYGDASRCLKIPVTTVRYRCISLNQKFSEWNIVSLEKDKMSMYKSGDKSGHKIVCNNLPFPSYSEASRFFKLSLSAVINRVKSSNFPNFYKE